MKTYRVNYVIPHPAGGGIRRSKSIRAEDEKTARSIFMAQAHAGGSSAKIESVQIDHCKNCGK